MPRLPRYRYFVAALLGLAASALLAACAVIVVTGLHDDDQPADLALVLGNAIDSQGNTSHRLAARLDRAVDLYRAKLVPRIIVSGGKGPGLIDEATAMQRYLVARGVPESAIDLDHDGVDTFHSARYTARLMRERHLSRVTVVSQHFHIARARLALQRFGVREVYSAHARYFEWRDFYSTLREVPAYIFYMVRSYS